MYYAIVEKDLCEERQIFLKNPRTKDGRVILTQRDLLLINFSLGMVELVNAADMQQLMAPVQVEIVNEGEEKL